MDVLLGTSTQYTQHFNATLESKRTTKKMVISSSLYTQCIFLFISSIHLLIYSLYFTLNQHLPAGWSINTLLLG